MQDVVSAAMTYATTLGWYVFPVEGKLPAREVGRWSRDSSRDPGQIAAWFTGRTGLGVAVDCGRSGLVVLDGDDPEVMSAWLGEENLGGAWVMRGNPARRSWVFRQRDLDRPIGCPVRGVEGGEVKGAGGYVVLPPSPHAVGGEYLWLSVGGEAPDVVPEVIVDLVPSTIRSGDPASGPEVLAALREWSGDEAPELLGHVLAKLDDDLARGSRHDAAFVAACWAAEDARAGFYPLAAALGEIRDRFVAALARGEARPFNREEWRRIAADAIGRAAGKSDVEVELRRTRATVSSRVIMERIEPVKLADAHDVFARWLGVEFDLDALDVLLAVAAVERLDGDPVWLLVVSGSGAAKTELVVSLAGAGAIATSTISSPGALLSATSRKDRAATATGGLLRVIGDRGLLVVKDVTSILSASRDARAEVLAALREVYDGSWVRNVGTDGGLTLPWSGRIVVVGAVTTAWDRAHSVVAAMGDRFVLVRIDSTRARRAFGRQAIANTGHEVVMRAELSAAAGGVLAHADVTGIELDDAEIDRLLSAADLVTLCRTAVEYDPRGEVIDAHAPEVPTRFAKQLGQIVRGAVAIGVDRRRALALAIRCARDSTPPLRLAIVDDLALHPYSSTREVRERLDQPRTTVDRQLQSLHLLGVVSVDESGGIWRYRLADGIDPTALSLEVNP